MPYNDPGHEHVHLSAYERRQFELIGETLANEDPRGVPDRKVSSRSNLLWWVLVVTAGFVMLFVGLVGAPLVAFFGAAAVAAAVLYRRGRRRGAERDTER